MTRRVTWAGAVIAVIGGAALGPWALRHMPFFRVRRVELVGLRYLAPERVLSALQLSPRQNVFDDTDAIEQRAAELFGVVSARVERRLPGTLRIQLVERVPVALAPGPKGLVPLDGAGHPLPYEPAASDLDLPVVRSADTALVGALARVRMADSTLFQDVDTAERGRRGDVVLDVGPRRVLLPDGATSDEIQALGLVRRHLAATGRAYDELDARFAGWVVARRSRS